MNYLFEFALAALFLNWILYFVYQIFFGGPKPIKAFILGGMGVIMMGLFGGEFVSAVILIYGNVADVAAASQMTVGLLGVVVALMLYWMAFDGSITRWWSMVRKRLERMRKK